MRTYRKLRSMYKPLSDDDGSFGVVHRNNVEWYTCREGFQSALQNYESRRPYRRFLFVTKSDHKNVVAFVKKIERIIRLPVKDRVKFHRTTIPNVMYLSLGKFWSSVVRCSLLTILLRAGRSYDRKKDNWQQVIEGDHYLQVTKYAISRFLDGYTKIVWVPDVDFSFAGWADELCHSKEQVDKILRKTNARRKRKKVCSKV